MKFKALAFSLALAAAGPSFAAACSNTFNLGSMGPPAITTFGNSFGTVQHFDDCYNFTLNGSADSFGLAWEVDASTRRDIDLSSIKLTGGNLVNAVVDPTAASFSFNNLLAGAYQFIISGDVTGRNGGLFGGGTVGYSGLFTTVGSPTVAAPVPEPETYAMLAMGLGVVGWAARRRKPQ